MPFKLGQSGNPKGRTKGSQNKITRVLKDSILEALEEAGQGLGSVGYFGHWNWNIVDPRAESKPGEGVPPASEAGAV